MVLAGGVAMGAYEARAYGRPARAFGTDAGVVRRLLHQRGECGHHRGISAGPARGAAARVLGRDGGMAANTPLDLVLDDNPDQEMLCFVVELFARQGSRPHTLAASANRAADLAFGNKTRRILEGRQREYRLKSLIGRLAAHLPGNVGSCPEAAAVLAEGRTDRTIAADRAGLDEAGLLKVLDFSRATFADRWKAGETAMRDAVAATSARLGSPGAELDVIEA